MALGWILILKGYALPGVCALAAFAALQIVQHRRRTALQEQPAGVAACPGETAPMSPRATVPTAARITRSQPESRWRRLVLASYGNAWLQGNIALEDWYRHRALWDAACLFRDNGDGRLLASNSLAWLQWIRARGATRISLYMTDELPAAAHVDQWDRQAMRVDFPGCHEIWMAGRESAACEASADPYTGYLAYEPEIDAYWRIRTGNGSNPPVQADWQQMRNQIQETLKTCRIFGIDPDLSEPGFTPLNTYFAHCPDWADLPLLPADETLAIPHELLRDLCRIRSGLESFCHPKNDASPYQSYSADDQKRLNDFRATLDRMIEGVQCAAGSEIRWYCASGLPLPGRCE